MLARLQGHGENNRFIEKALTKGVVDAHGPGHALLTLNRGEDLGRVLESDGTFT
jgi:hypothetical protein